jgi:hypothetical protein
MPASLLKTLFRMPPRASLRPRPRHPPRSHSQIRFTRSNNTRPAAAAANLPRAPHPGTKPNSSPNAIPRGQAHKGQTPGPDPQRSDPRGQMPEVRCWGSGLISGLCPPISGGERDRTDDLLLAKQALSQLSYTPGGQPTEDGRRIPFSVVCHPSFAWWAREDLNLRPHAYQARALTS